LLEGSRLLVLALAGCQPPALGDPDRQLQAIQALSGEEAEDHVAYLAKWSDIGWDRPEVARAAYRRELEAGLVDPFPHTDDELRYVRLAFDDETRACVELSLLYDIAVGGGDEAFAAATHAALVRAREEGPCLAP
jgi:hypothetical protein